MKKSSPLTISKAIFIRNEEAFKSLLDKRSFELLKLRTIEGMTYNAIGKRYGISGTRIYQICARSVDRIKQARYSIR